MRIKTPKRYRSGRQERRMVGSWRGIRNFVLILILGVGAYWVYNNQARSQELVIEAREVLNQQLEGVQTAVPRQPTPTPDISNEVINAATAYQTGDFVAAISNYYEVIKGAPNDLEAHYRLALLLVITSDLGADTAQLDEAIRVSELAINAAPEKPDGWAIKAMALGWRGRNGEAIAYATQALELDPNFTQAQAYLAEAYRRLDRPNLAEQTINQAVEALRTQGSAAPETVVAVFRAQGYIAERDPEAPDRETAIQAYETAYRALPTFSHIALELALSYFGNGQTDEAIALLNRALDVSPRNVALLNQLGRIYLNIGDGDNSSATFQRCIDADPTFAPCLSWLGGLQYASGSYTLAVNNLQAAINNGSDDWSDWLQLGLSHTYMLRCDLAIPIFRDGYVRVKGNATREERFASALRECGVQPLEPLETPAP